MCVPYNFSIFEIKTSSVNKRLHYIGNISFYDVNQRFLKDLTHFVIPDDVGHFVEASINNVHVRKPSR